MRMLTLCMLTAMPLYAANNDTPQLQVKQAGQLQSYPLPALLKTLTQSQIRLFDPNFNTEKTYRVVTLSDVLAATGIASLAMDDELVVLAQDGYAPTLSAAQLKQQPLLAFAEQSHADFQFTALTQTDRAIDPGPLYLVWPNDSKGHQPWPFQVVSLEVVRFVDKYAGVLPKPPVTAEVAAGFTLFKQHCLRCHAINRQGGHVGPDLTMPRNVIEYWQPEQLPLFIQNAASFRWNSKMPAFDDLTKVQIQSIITYLANKKLEKDQSIGRKD